MRAQIIDFGPYRSYNRGNSEVKHDGLIIKASDGDHVHRKWEEHINNPSVQETPVVIQYHWQQSHISVSKQIAAIQKANRMAEDAGIRIKVVANDFERRGNTLTWAFGNDCFEIMTDLDSWAIELLYTNPATYQEWLWQQGHRWMSQFDLWIAQWPYRGWHESMLQVPDESYGWQPRLPAGATSWKIWQYSADGNGQSKRHGTKNSIIDPSSQDLDVFDGTREEFFSWAGVGDPNPPEDELDDLRARLHDAVDIEFDLGK